MLTDAGADILRSFQFTIKNFLADTEEDAPVDLRDLQTVLHAAVDDVILGEIISRRLSKNGCVRAENTQEENLGQALLDLGFIPGSI